MLGWDIGEKLTLEVGLVRWLVGECRERRSNVDLGLRCKWRLVVWFGWLRGGCPRIRGVIAGGHPDIRVGVHPLGRDARCARLPVDDGSGKVGLKSNVSVGEARRRRQFLLGAAINKSPSPFPGNLGQ